MKLTPNTYKEKGAKGSVIVDTWRQAAIQTGLESGICVEVIIRVEKTKGADPYMTEIAFKVMDHEFASLSALKKAVNNRMFL